MADGRYPRWLELEIASIEDVYPPQRNEAAMSSEHPPEELELHRVDLGEQGLTAQENEIIALRNRVRELEAERDAARGYFANLTARGSVKTNEVQP